MTKSHSFKFLKYLLITLVVYNVISLLILFLPFKSLKYSLWNLMPYDYKYLVNYPTNQKDLSLLNSTNRDRIKEGLNKNSSRNILSVNYWNYNLIIDSYSKENNNDFENSFINLFYLTKKNQPKNFDLKKFFISNYKYFSEKNKKIILDNYL
ncbi:hypothetical protein [Candidatus Pelagibacter communis]|uniref:hypothetical protein n=1 Tax=Pelagibacter ubique TaxID=198252 RepID=UPI0015CF81C9|nr:hypothetical protein [Candidatus Pelagibacter ubique]